MVYWCSMMDVWTGYASFAVLVLRVGRRLGRGSGARTGAEFGGGLRCVVRAIAGNGRLR